MKSNPFSNLPNPSNIPDPKNITISEFERYHSREMEKFHQNMKVFKRSAKYLGGCLGFLLVLSFWTERKVRNHVFGADNQGGNYLNMTTPYDEDHYAYNREFQRMHVLGQAKLPDTTKTSSQLLTDLGVNLKNYGSSHLPKKAPHEKYY